MTALAQEKPWQRVEVIGDATLYLGDCLQVLPHIGRVDAVVTDPPYGTNVTSWDESIGSDAIRGCIEKSRGYAVFFYSNTRLWHLLNEIKEAGADAWVMVWHKSNAMGFERRFSPQWVPVVCAYRGNPKFWGQDYIHGAIVPQGVDHPTPKPLAVVRWLAERASESGDTILDPFMGSGTTGVACMNLGRKFIGIEIEPKYFDIACERISRAQQQGRLFDERPKAEQVGLL